MVWLPGERTLELRGEGHLAVRVSQDRATALERPLGQHVAGDIDERQQVVLAGLELQWRPEHFEV